MHDIPDTPIILQTFDTLLNSPARFSKPVLYLIIGLLDEACSSNLCRIFVNTRVIIGEKAEIS